jgi:hypothetical protein
MVALRAAALGRFELARNQARWVLAANPRSADGWIAWAVSATPDAATEAPRAVGPSERDTGAPSPLGVRLLADVLLRRVGASAAQAWLSAQQPLPAPADALEREVDARLEPLRRSVQGR